MRISEFVCLFGSVCVGELVCLREMVKAGIGCGNYHAIFIVFDLQPRPMQSHKHTNPDTQTNTHTHTHTHTPSNRPKHTNPETQIKTQTDSHTYTPKLCNSGINLSKAKNALKMWQLMTQPAVTHVDTRLRSQDVADLRFDWCPRMSRYSLEPSFVIRHDQHFD